jgi:hypothetical protein
MRGDKIDQAVKQRFLAALEPAQLEVSLAALDQIEARPTNREAMATPPGAGSV